MWLLYHGNQGKKASQVERGVDMHEAEYAKTRPLGFIVSGRSVCLNTNLTEVNLRRRMIRLLVTEQWEKCFRIRKWWLQASPKSIRKFEHFPEVDNFNAYLNFISPSQILRHAHKRESGENSKVKS
jgi:hypothetical protein